MAVQFRILGSLEVVVEGRKVPVGAGKQRELLALLLIHANGVVSTDVVIDGLWGERPRERAREMVQVYVSRLRKAFGGADPDGVDSHELLVTSGPGYSLRIGPGQLDAHRFEHLAREGSALMAAGDAAGADATLRDALLLWRGAPLADVSHEPFAQLEIARLEEQRLAAVESRIDARLALG